MNNLSPKISVIMGIYNCASTLKEAVDSIINQTYTNWELILCDDGSKDNTLALAKEFAAQDNRIVVIQNNTNRGLNYTLNHCLKYAQGEYIARMDGDDSCDPSRFMKQVAILEKNSDIAIVSSEMNYFDESGIWGQSKSIERPVNKDFIRGTPFCHAPCMVRKEAYDAVNGYSEADILLRVEDYHLWIKMYSKGYKGLNIKEPLYSMRDDRNAYNRRKFKYRINEAYVRYLAARMLSLPLTAYIYTLRPILVGILPNFLYDYLHKRRLNK
ncbi:MAG: glycosyltransferase family 2 protein [Phocaeicola sp.]